MTLLAFAGVGVTVAVVVMVLSGSPLLGLAYGVAPGLVLGGLAWLRVVRGGLFNGPGRPGRSDPSPD
jgi:hypothetical protein